MKPGWTYRVISCEVIDGDTVKATLDLGFHVTISGYFRLAGIDAPEKRPLVSRQAAIAAENFLRQLVEGALAMKALTIRTEKNDSQEKYGRWLAWLGSEDGGPTFNERMINAGHAKHYFGGMR